MLPLAILFLSSLILFPIMLWHFFTFWVFLLLDRQNYFWQYHMYFPEFGFIFGQKRKLKIILLLFQALSFICLHPIILLIYIFAQMLEKFYFLQFYHFISTV